MIDTIRQHQELFGLIRNACEENGIGADLDPSLADADGFPLDDRVIILKIDEYYNALKIANRPKSIDFLVLVKCCDMASYSLYLIELKNTNDREQLRSTKILEKFKTTVDDFVQEKFGDIFSGRTYRKIKLYLVSHKKTPPPDAKKNKSSQFDAFSTVRPFRLLGASVMIEPKLPNPVIEPC